MKTPTYRIEGYIGDGRNTGEALAGFLSLHPGRTVDVIVNSAGGSALEGAAILAEAEAHGRVRFRVRGIAASSATLMLCGGREVLMHPAAVWMGHLPWQMTVGDANEHLRAAELLDKIGRSDAEVYSRFSGIPVARIHQWLSEELWLDAKEAIALGFADGFEKTAAPERAAKHDYTGHAGAPQALQRLARDEGWVASPPEPKPISGGEQCPNN